MADKVSKEKRSEIMSKVRSNNNKSTELAFRSILKANMISGWKRDSTLLGKPDFIFPKNKVVIFLDGCYWHGCARCYRRPKTNKKYWDNKIIRNKKRDKRVNRMLKEKGYAVIRIWEHQIKKPKFILNKLYGNKRG